MTNISRIAMFLEVARFESFTKAARNLGMTGPALSKQVNALEEDLQVRLFHRTTRHVALTEAGALYADRARKAMEDLEEAALLIQELKEKPKGHLKISVPMSFGQHCLLPFLTDFAKNWPEVSLNIDFDDRHVDLLEEGFDVVVRIGALKNSSLIARKLKACPIILCASKACIARHGKPDSPQDLADYPHIAYTRHGLETQWHYQHKNGDIGVVSCFNTQGAANHADMMVQLCLSGCGMALIPVFAVHDHLKDGSLEQILPDYSTWPRRNIYALFAANRYLSIKQRLFIDGLNDYLKKMPW
jgi:DNA-binding transcriptional LysR family regulator